MQKHAERTDKRPPISGGRGNGQGNSNNQNNGNNSNNSNTTNNNGIAMNVALAPATQQEHPYWPKVSPDSAAIPNEINTHLQHQHQQHHHEFQLINSHDLQHHQRDESIEDLRQNGHLNSQSLVLPPSSTPNVYDGQSKISSNSAFTPINAMPSHLNIQHHQLSQRPSYIYDALSFQNKNVAQNSNGFPNQLISLHQIRNYAHQPGSGVMSGEHILGVSVGKDKG
jgi:zinc finger protein 362/384